MAYLGHKPAVGENNSFRILDDISSFVLTFDGSSASVVGLSDETITITENNHRFITGQRVTYSNGGGGNITGLVNGQAYFVINHSKTQIKLANSASNALAGTAVNLTGLGTGSSHTLTLAFDGINTKFDPTFGDGMHDTLIKRAAQLVISINGVIQQPHDTATPSTGFGVDSLGHIIFSTAPASTDIFWGHILATNTVTFDSSDNDVDTFTGNGSTTSFTLSKIPPDNRNILVTIDGVVQYPSDAANTRSYSVSENVMTFVSAPGNGTVIQVRHIGYAGIGAGGGGGVTGFYGRTGNVSLVSTDNIVANNATFSGNVSIAQTLTYEDVTDIDSVGLITARSGIKDQTLTAGRVIYVDSDKTLTDSANLTFDGNDVGIARSIFHLGDTNTTIGFPENDKILLRTGGTDRVSVTGAGLSITAGNPALRLHGTSSSFGDTAKIIASRNNDGSLITGSIVFDPVNAAGADIIFNTRDSNTVGERVRIKNDGTVGIGSADPVGVLDLYHATNNTILNVKSGDSGSVINLIDNATRSSIEQNGTTLKIISDTAGTYANSDIRLQVDGATRLQVYDDGELKNIGIETSYVTTAFAANFAKLDIRGTNIANSNHYILSYGAGHANNQEFHMVNTLGEIVFRTGSGSDTDRLRIDTSGRISNNSRVATDYGSPNLLISGTNSTFTLMGDGSTNNSSFTGIKFRVAGGSTGDYTKAGIFAQRQSGYNDLDLIFALDTVADATSVSIADEKMRITSDGDVLINQPAQQSGRLTIKGTNSNGSTCYAITNSGKALEGIDITCTTVGDGNYGGAISFGCGGNGRSAIAAVQSGSDDDVNGLAFFTHSSNAGADDTAERLRITSGGLLKVNSTDGGSYHTIRLNTTTNNAIKDVLHVHSSVDGAVAAAGYGVRLNFSGEQSNGNEYTFGGIAGLFNSTGATYGDLAFYTNNNGTNGERLRIYSSGRILIGNGAVEQSPSGNLDIVGDTNSNGPELYLRVSNNNTTDNIGALIFGNNVDKTVCMIRGSTHTANNTGDIEFHTSTSGTMKEKVRIFNDGRVRIQGEENSGNQMYLDIIGNSQTETAGLRLAGCRFIGPESRRMYFEIQGNDPSDHFRFITSPNNDRALDSVALHIGNNNRIGMSQTDPDAATLHIGNSYATTSSNVALQVGTISGQNRYLTINHFNNQQNFSSLKMRVNDNAKIAMINMGNPHAGVGYGSQILFHGPGDAQNGGIEVVNQNSTGAASNMIFRINNGSDGQKECLKLQDNEDVRVYNGLAIAKIDNDSSNFTKSGLVLSTPTYNEYHYVWGDGGNGGTGHAGYKITMTCGSYFHSEFIYTQHQTNGGHHMHTYARGKWANNHTTHTGFMYEFSGGGSGLTHTFTVSDQNDNGTVDLKSGLTAAGAPGATYRGSYGGGNENTSSGTGSATGKFVIDETRTYNTASTTVRGLIIRVFFGSFSISKSTN